MNEPSYATNLGDNAGIDPALRPRTPGLDFEMDSPIAGAVSMADLLRFAAIMQVEGRPVQPTRMLYDRRYAFDQLALAHQSESSTLRRLSLDLFERYQLAGEWIGLVR